MHWRYSECRAALDAAGRLINTELAERRMVLRNPVEGNEIATTNFPRFGTSLSSRSGSEFGPSTSFSITGTQLSGR